MLLRIRQHLVCVLNLSCILSVSCTVFLLTNITQKDPYWYQYVVGCTPVCTCGTTQRTTYCTTAKPLVSILKNASLHWYTLINVHYVLPWVLMIIVERWCKLILCGDKVKQCAAVIHRHIVLPLFCIAILFFLLQYVTSATFFSQQWQTIWFSHEISLPRLMSVGFHRWVIVLICSWMLWHVLWCSAALMHASAYWLVGWEKHKSYVANILLLHCGIAKSITLLTLLSCLDLVFKSLCA